MRIEKGEAIKSVDEMLAQEWIFFRDKLNRPMWLSNFALAYILEVIRRGEVRQALVENPLTGELEGQLNLYQMEDGRPLTPAELRRERENNR